MNVPVQWRPYSDGSPSTDDGLPQAHEYQYWIRLHSVKISRSRKPAQCLSSYRVSDATLEADLDPRSIYEGGGVLTLGNPSGYQSRGCCIGFATCTLPVVSSQPRGYLPCHKVHQREVGTYA